MTIWTDVVNFVRARHEVLEESDTWLRFRLGLEGDRTQQVSVRKLPEVGGTAWIEISSPVGWAKSIDTASLLKLAGTAPVGGAAVVDGVALLKHAMPLTDLGVREEFEPPLRLLATQADAFEQELTHADEF
ncbi:hypothetical protein [Amycolatopsis sp. H20-H5]|uniref:hypothetical protein n=1 Tax=Amycolatopsis sp. H20-H5 TaxID=3046309 RepID=UPI002DBECDBA|nr:hypothetical protein [Amycolatopsis sp. H20-H5]MEC3978311.1 hypothetical protein [Amycolatopsis sp. H20-H5]